MFPFKGADSIFMKVGFKPGGDNKLLVEKWKSHNQNQCSNALESARECVGFVRDELANYLEPVARAHLY